MQIINNRFLSLYDYNFLLVIEMKILEDREEYISNKVIPSNIMILSSSNQHLHSYFLFILILLYSGVFSHVGSSCYENMSQGSNFRIIVRWLTVCCSMAFSFTKPQESKLRNKRISSWPSPCLV